MNFFDYFILYYLHTAFGATYILTELICCLSVSLIFNKLRVRRYQDWIRLLIDWSCTWILYLFLSCFFYYIFETTGHTDYSSYQRFFIWPLVSLLHSLYPKDTGKYKMRLTCAIFSSTLVILAISISGSVGSFISQTSGFPNSTLSDCTLYIILLGIIAIVTLFKIFSPFRYKYIRQAPVILINVIFVLSYILNVVNFSLSSESALFECFLFIGLLAMDYISYIIFYLTVKDYNDILDYQIKVVKAESEMNQLEISKAQYEDLHRIRHDLKNQMTFLGQLFAEQKYDEMKEYFADLSEKVHVTIDYIDSGNSFINSVLNMELSKAKSFDMSLETHLSVTKDLPIDGQDLTSLLTNVIDNAIEAQNRNGLKDPIAIHLLYDKNYLFVKVINHILVDENHPPLTSLRSSKTDRKNHGYGTKIIRSICEKYNGACHFNVKDNLFVFEGMLYLPMKGDAE